MVAVIRESELERWRQLSDELLEQVEYIKTHRSPQTKPEWEAIILVERASRDLFGAVGWIALQRQEEANAEG